MLYLCVEKSRAIKVFYLSVEKKQSKAAYLAGSDTGEVIAARSQINEHLPTHRHPTTHLVTNYSELTGLSFETWLIDPN